MSAHSAERYTAPIPEAWPGLLAYAQNIVAQEVDPTETSREGALELCREIDRLDNERLDATMYHGQGLLMCQFAQLIGQPTIRDELVQSIAGKQLAHFLTGPDQVLNQYAIDENITRSELMQTARQAAERLDPAERLLMNALSAMAINRRFVAAFPRIMNDLPITAFYLRRLRDGIIGPSHLAENATAGAGRVLNQVIKRCAGLDEAPLAEVVASGVLACPEAYRKAAVGGAQVRLDVINDFELFQDLFSVDDEGNLVFDREHLRTPPPPPKPSGPNDISLPVLRQERLGCPAIRVPGLISLALGLKASIMIETQKLYEAHQAAERSHHLFALTAAA